MAKKNLIVGQSGGPTAVINSSLYGVVSEGLAHSDEIGHVYGMINGIEGFLAGRILDFEEALPGEKLSYLKHTPGAYLGSCRYKLPESLEDPVYPELFRKFEEMNIGWFFYIGGNDSMDTVSKLSRYAAKVGSSIRVIGEPKTIDNDLVGTDVSFGFQSAVDIATNTIDCIHTTAASHSRVFIVELMGHKTGWLTLHAGIAGGSDVILIPEIPYDLDKVVEAINKRINDKKHFTILAVAEGIISKEEMLYSKKELKEVRKKEHYPSAAYRIGAGIMDRTGQEVRVTVPGHVQRGGSPCAYDRVLASRLGAKAAELIMNKEYGYMVCVRNNQIDKIELNKVAGRLKTVDPQAGIITEAKAMGICFGD